MIDTADVSSTLITLTADIVAAHVANNSVSVADIATLIGNVHSALAGLGAAPVPDAESTRPAVSVRASIKPEYIICLEDGKKLKMLKRHLMSRYQMTPADYRAKWNLPADYPMVAPDYAEKRRALAHKIGLGRKAKVAEPAVAAAPPEKRKPGRPRKKLAFPHPTK